MRDFQDLNDTSKYLSHLIIKPGSISSLINFGLENIYIDDFKHRCKYVDCLLFLMNPSISRNSKTYEEFEKKIVSFESFYDYYETEEVSKYTQFKKIMYVFKIPDHLVLDYHFFRLKQYHNLSDLFWQSIGAKVPLDFTHIEYNIENEIYMFDKSLSITNVHTIKKGE